LNIPYSFYDESHTNFFGSRAAWLHYDRSCMDARDDQLELRREYTIWQLRGAIRDQRLVLPASMGIQDLRWEWVPVGMPWWDPAKEVKGFESAMANALDTPQRICRSTGSDFMENVDAIAEAQEYAESKGVGLRFAMGEPEPDATADDIAQDERDEAEKRGADPDEDQPQNEDDDQ
jgi:capsid protein